MAQKKSNIPLTDAEDLWQAARDLIMLARYCDDDRIGGAFRKHHRGPLRDLVLEVKKAQAKIARTKDQDFWRAYVAKIYFPLVRMVYKKVSDGKLTADRCSRLLSEMSKRHFGEDEQLSDAEIDALTVSYAQVRDERGPAECAAQKLCAYLDLKSVRSFQKILNENRDASVGVRAFYTSAKIVAKVFNIDLSKISKTHLRAQNELIEAMRTAAHRR
jgi:hypothetical protein